MRIIAAVLLLTIGGCVGGCPSTSKSVRPAIRYIKLTDSTEVHDAGRLHSHPEEK